MERHYSECSRPSGARIWTRARGFDNTSSDSANSLAIRPNGDVLVTGGTVGWFVTGEYDPAGCCTLHAD